MQYIAQFRELFCKSKSIKTLFDIQFEHYDI